MHRRCVHGAVLGVLVTSCFVLADTAVWTGRGSDDRWANPDNWLNGTLPTENDDIVFDPTVHPEHWGGQLNTSVTIDSTAWAHNLSFYQYGEPEMPFERIHIRQGADFRLNGEWIDQSMGGIPRYT
ncbi:MAG TPA: hypothetical protein PKG54_12055 [Phycisphaerae bacterium]|jgi:hypothetical protein|nr:hypothetical protein [Phycisphaerae bacterium]HOB75244.1 hypothetical protein [Phycisphaerae bacterium]HOJ54725.1 hypothetical protein [Phycisphaerae bacterium]HOL25924.1 hypothetical protein [Phycisphaerae bacterium]HPP19503.1 hypothetical protein [Phycisphaerae bacterium]